jgi:outer membrane autotransporter protein
MLRNEGQMAKRRLRSRHVSSLLASSAVLLGMGMLASKPAMAVCVLDGDTLTCSGDLTTGVSNPRDFTVPPVHSLVVNDLTADIAPTADNSSEREGVFFRAEFSTEPVITLDVDTGEFVIRTDQEVDVGGALGVGVTAQESDLIVNVTGDIFTDAGDTSQALMAATAVSGDITVTSAGVRDTVGPNADGIWVVKLDTFVFIEQEGDDIIILDESMGLGDGNITLAHTGAITTRGESSDGVRAVLGAGLIDLDITASIATQGDESSGIFSLAEASIMDIHSSGDISTIGEASLGIVAQTQFDGDITITSTGNIQTQGNLADGINVLVGEDGGVSITSTGNIGTSGDNADAIRAELVGEGAILVASEGNLATTGANATGLVANHLGDGNIFVVSVGDITTSGQLAHGVEASAVTGDVQVYRVGDTTVTGTGAAGLSASTETGFAYVESEGNVDVAWGDGIQASAVDGTAYIYSVGDVTGGTTAGASALTARVFGNGSANVYSVGNVVGGQGGTSAPAIIARTEGNGGAFVTSFGDVSTSNDAAHALVAIAENGNAQIITSGNVTALGAGSDAIHLEADDGFSGFVSIDADSVIRGGSGDGAAIALYGNTIPDASDNIVSIGAGAEVSAASGLAIYAESGNDVVSNNGFIQGNVFLGAGDNLFENLLGSRFEPGDTVGIGIGRTLNNFGEISPFGDGVIGTTVMEGNLVLQPEGTLFVDVAADGTGDLFDITGSAELGGLLNVNALDPAEAFTLGEFIPLLATTDGVTGLFVGVQDNLEAINFIPVSANGGTAIVLEIQDKDFATLPDGCTYSSPVITCGGDLSDGAAELGVSPNIISQDATTIVVEGLAGDISRAFQGAVAIGLSDYTDAGITIDVDLGEHEINMPSSNGYGIVAYDLRDGDIDITSQGTIRVNGGTAIYAYGEDETNISIDHTGDLFARNPDSTVVWARSYGSGDVMVNVDGNVTVTHQFSVGIAAVSTLGDVTVDYDGTMSVQGAQTGGIYLAVRDTGNIDVTSAGTFMRGPLGSAVFAIRADHLGDGNISVLNDADVGPGLSTAIQTSIAGDGDISVTNNGEFFQVSSTGISAEITGSGDISVTNNADMISALVGTLDRTQMDTGIEAIILEGEGDITVVNRGDIRAQEAIDARGPGAVSVDSIGDLVAGFGYAIRVYGDDITVRNEGNISTGFNDLIAGGIYARTPQNGSIDIVNQGDIVVINEFHDFQSGIVAFVRGADYDEEPDLEGAPTVSIVNVGDITLNSNQTYRIDESGIWVHQGDLYNKGVNNGTATVSQTGDITVTGVGVYGIELGESQTNERLAAPDETPRFPTYASYMNTTVDMVGSILAAGDESIGIRSAVKTDVTAVFNLSGGDVTGGSTIGAGIVTLETEAGGLNVFNIGSDVTVSAESGRAFIGGEGIEEINLSGSLVGIVDLDDGDDSLWGAATGAIEGDADLGDGDDRFAFENGFSVTGSLDGGDGTDVIGADIGSGTSRTMDLAPLSLTGFEIIEKTGAGTLALAGISGPILLQADGGLSTTTADLADLDVEVNSDAVVRTDYLVGDVTINAGGTFGGNATTGDLVNNGLLTPGNSPGTITVTGDYVQGADGVLQIEFGPTGETDLVSIAGTASLAGTLDLILYDPDVQGGDVFTFLIADGGIDGAFATVNTPEGLDVTVVTVGNQMNIQVASIVMGGCVQDGTSVVCEGIDPDGFENAVEDGLDVLVEPDALVLNVDGNGLDLGDDNVVDNQGTINVAGDGIHAGDGNTIINSSADTIIAGGSGIVTGDDSDIANPGTITADGDGIETGANSIVDNSGTITAGDDGMTVGDGSDVLNTGTIESLDIAILAGDNHNADLDGDGNAGIVNEGIIDSQVDGIFAGDNSVIVNRGDIFARNARADAPNDGDFNFLADSALTQQGTGIGVGSNNTVINEAGATITAHNAGIATALPDGTGNTIINEGTIDAVSLVEPDGFGFGTGISAGADNVIENRTGAVIHANQSGINAGAGSSVINQAGATINAVTNGIVIGSDGATGGTAVNDGLITVSGGLFGGTGILIWDGVSATNNGTIESAGSGFYVNSGEGSVLLNNGLINAGANGFDLFSGSTATNGADGVINATGGAGSDAIAAYGTDNAIVNEGELHSTGGNGIGIYVAGPTSIDNSGLIDGALAAIQGGDGVETITNTGTIAGDVALAGGDDLLGLGDGSAISGALDGGAGSDAIASTGDGTIEGSITAFESLTVESGTLGLSLTGPSDVTATAVTGGRLDLEGSLTTDTETSGGGVLAGNGTVDGTLENGGTVAPGGSIGTLAVTGDFTQTADGVLAIEFGPTGQTDLLDIGGSASLAGTLDYYLVDNGVAVGDVFTFLMADGGVSGTFDLVNNALGAVGNFDVVYDDFEVSLTILSLEGCIQTGSDVLCSGVDPNGFTNIADDGLDTLVELGAVVNNPDGNGLTLGDDGTILNEGTVDAAEDGIRLGAGNALVNRGTIRGGVAGIRLDGVGNSVDNQAGALIAGPVAITSGAAGQTVTNRTGATIDGGILLDGGDSEVALETGSILIGGVRLGGTGDTLRLFGAGEDVVPLDVEGVELLVKEGAGRWSLNGSLAVGGTSVREGTLVVGGLVPVDDDEDPETPDILQPAGDAVLTSPLVDVSGGILAGHGTIMGDLVARSGGRIAPGTSVGTLTVVGDVAFEPLGEMAGGVFEADLADDGSHDLLDVRSDEEGDGGAVGLAGTLDVVLDAEFRMDDPETPDVDESLDGDGNRVIQADFSQEALVADIIVAEGGVEGAFEAVSFDGGPNDGAVVVRDDDPSTADVDETVRVPLFKGYLEYLPDRVRITSIPDLAPAAATDNQAAVADVLDGAVPYGLGTDLLTGVISQVGVSGDVPAALDALHGEWYNAFHEAAFNFSRGTLRQAELRSLEARSGTRDSSAVTLRNAAGSAAGGSSEGAARFWIAAAYDTVDIDANNGFMGYGIDTLSGYLGVDYRVTDGVLVGAMGGFGNADVDKDGGAASGDVDSWQIAGYLSLFGDGWFIDVAGGYGEFDVKSSRDIGFGNVALTAAADYDGDATFFSGRAGYGFDLGNGGWQATPEIGLTYVKSNQDGFLETGAAPINLAVDPLNAESLRLSGQLRLSKSVRTSGGGTFAYYVRAGVAHELEDGLRPITARFQGTTADFTVYGQPGSDTTAVFGAGLSGEVGSGISLFLDYSGEMGGRFSAHAITGGARIRF